MRAEDRAMRTIGVLAAVFTLIASTAAAQLYDDGELGWGPYYSNHLSPYDGRLLGPPLSALPPGTEYYNGVPRTGYPITAGPIFGPERAYYYPRRVYRPGSVVKLPRHAVRSGRVAKRRVARLSW